MQLTARSIRWSRHAFLAFPLVLVGCQRGETPVAATRSTTEAERPLTVANPAEAPAPLIPANVPARTPFAENSRLGGTTEQTGIIAPPERAAVRDRATLDAAAAQVQHKVEETSAAVATRPARFSRA